MYSYIVIFLLNHSINTFQGYQSGQSPPSPRPSPQQLQILKLLSQHMGDKAQQNMMQQNHVSFQLKLFLLPIRPSSHELLKSMRQQINIRVHSCFKILSRRVRTVTSKVSMHPFLAHSCPLDLCLSSHPTPTTTLLPTTPLPHLTTPHSLNIIRITANAVLTRTFCLEKM